MIDVAARPRVRRGTGTAGWVCAVATYGLAVLHRSSLGVAGLELQDRIDVGPFLLGTFTATQVLVYVLLQIPAGALVDRFGTRRVLLAATGLLLVGQLLFAVADSYALAFTARVLVGCGDALTFVAAVRVVAATFSRRHAPLMTQATGFLGQLGALGAALPLAWGLEHLGWGATFALTAAPAPLLAVAGWHYLAPAGSAHDRAGPSRVALSGAVIAQWRRPQIRTAFWIHFTAQFGLNTVVLIWGYPYLTNGQGRPAAEAGALISLSIVTMIVGGFVLGWLSGRYPRRRVLLAAGVIVLTISAWSAVLLTPAPAPAALLVALFAVIGAGGPASLLALDLVRVTVPPAEAGLAIGMVNSGGFLATILAVVLIAATLSMLGGESGPAAFRGAMAMQGFVWLLGLVMLARGSRRMRS